MNHFFDKNIEPRCEYCVKGQMTQDGKNVLCRKKGIVNKNFSCRSFEYDPIMRKPKITVPKIPEYSPEEFTL